MAATQQVENLVNMIDGYCSRRWLSFKCQRIKS